MLLLLTVSLLNKILRAWESMKWSSTREALDCWTHSLCQYHRKCRENSMENMHTDLRLIDQGIWLIDVISLYCILNIFFLQPRREEFSTYFKNSNVMWDSLRWNKIFHLICSQFHFGYMGQISDIHYSEILVATVKLLIKKSTKIKGNEWIYVVYTQWLCKSNLL